MLPDTNEDDIRFVLTVPAIWNEAAKQFMREAASKVISMQDFFLLCLFEYQNIILPSSFDFHCCAGKVFYKY